MRAREAKAKLDDTPLDIQGHYVGEAIIDALHQQGERIEEVHRARDPKHYGGARLTTRSGRVTVIIAPEAADGS